MKTKLIQTDLYLLLIDTEAETIKYLDYVYREIFNTIARHINDNPEKLWQGCKKIIAWYPLTDEAKELDLPWLPNPFKEVDFDNTSELKILLEKRAEKSNTCDLNEYALGLLAGYKAAQSKQFSLEDVENILIRYLEEGFISKEQGYINPNSFLKSLSTQQLPKFFIPEENYGDGALTKYKTITNSAGKIEILGTYIY